MTTKRLSICCKFSFVLQRRILTRGTQRTGAFFLRHLFWHFVLQKSRLAAKRPNRSCEIELERALPASSFLLRWRFLGFLSARPFWHSLCSRPSRRRDRRRLAPPKLLRSRRCSPLMPPTSPRASPNIPSSSSSSTLHGNEILPLYLYLLSSS